MTNEIKEILDNLKEVWISPDGDYMNNELDERKTNLLLDYITNLQEENEKLKNLYTNEKSHKIDCNYFKTLYSKVDKNIVIDDLVYKCEQCRVLYDNVEKTSIENMNLQQRIDKAVEYIEEYQEVLKEHNGDWLNYQEGFKPYLLDILRGEE